MDCFLLSDKKVVPELYKEGPKINKGRFIFCFQFVVESTSFYNRNYGQIY